MYDIIQLTQLENLQKKKKNWGKKLKKDEARPFNFTIKKNLKKTICFGDNKAEQSGIFTKYIFHISPWSSK